MDPNKKFVPPPPVPDDEPGFRPPPPVPDDEPAASPTAKSEDRGFFGSFIGHPSDFVEGAKGFGRFALHALDPRPSKNSLAALGNQTIDLGKSTVDAFRRGDVIGGTRRGANTLLNFVAPGLGAQSEAAGQQFDRGNVRGGLGSTAALGVSAAAGVKTPGLAKRAAAAEVHPFQADPRVATTRALGPLSKDPDFAKPIPDTLARVRQANGGENPATVTGGQVDMIPAIERTIAQHQDAIEPFMARAKGVQVSGDALVEAAERAIPNLDKVRDPAGTAAVVQRVRDAFGGKMWPVETFKDWLKTENADLNAFYKRAPDAQQTGVIAGSTPAIEKAIADATRDTLYKAIDPEGAGANIRTIQGKTKNLFDFKNAVSARSGNIIAQEPLNPVEVLTRPLKRLLPFGHSKTSALTGAAAAEARTMPLLRRAFDSVDSQLVDTLPKPASEFYPTGNPQRLLGPGDRITPPPADTSYVRTVSPGLPSRPAPFVGGQPPRVTLGPAGSGIPGKPAPFVGGQPPEVRLGQPIRPRPSRNVGLFGPLTPEELARLGR